MRIARESDQQWKDEFQFETGHERSVNRRAKSLSEQEVGFDDRFWTCDGLLHPIGQVPARPRSSSIGDEFRARVIVAIAFMATAI